MAEPFIAEIKMFGGNFAPRGYAYCNGQLLPIAQNTALFSLVGTTYGGDGRTTLALPNLKERVPMHPGRGPGLTQRRLGERAGVSTVTLAETQIPSHNHALSGTESPAQSASPENAVFAKSQGEDAYSDGTTNLVNMDAGMVRSVGGGGAHNNMQPYTAVSFIIALTGLFPSRS